MFWPGSFKCVSGIGDVETFVIGRRVLLTYLIDIGFGCGCRCTLAWLLLGEKIRKDLCFSMASLVTAASLHALADIFLQALNVSRAAETLMVQEDYLSKT